MRKTAILTVELECRHGAIVVSNLCRKRDWSGNQIADSVIILT
jgi:hypothetical protein